MGIKEYYIFLAGLKIGFFLSLRGGGVGQNPPKGDRGTPRDGPKIRVKIFANSVRVYEIQGIKMAIP